MPADIPALTADAAFEQRDHLLRVTDRAGRTTCDVRVDDGLPFVRFPSGPAADQWQPVSQQSIFALFTADSPIATFLRRQGVNPLRMLLTDLAPPVAGTDA